MKTHVSFEKCESDASDWVGLVYVILGIAEGGFRIVMPDWLLAGSSVFYRGPASWAQDVDIDILHVRILARIKTTT